MAPSGREFQILLPDVLRLFSLNVVVFSLLTAKSCFPWQSMNLSSNMLGFANSGREWGESDFAGGKNFYEILLCGGENLRRSEFDNLKLF